MMYQSKMALAVKVPTRNKHSVAREIGDAVYLPFGCEYSLLIKNLNSVKAKVRVWIDGTNVTEGVDLIINPNSSMDLERFIKNGNLTEGNKFKFIERTAAVSEHRGNKIDDGLIRVEFEFEETTYYSGVQGSSNVAYGSTELNCSASASSETAQLKSAGSPMRARGTSAGVVAPQAAEVGITVAGGVSDQQFHTTSWFPTDGIKHVMVMRVLGEVEGEKVVEPVTVKAKPTCSSCGKVNKANAKFCAECGTGLQIV